MSSPKSVYERRKEKFEKLSKKQSETINFISTLRFLIFVLGIAVSYVTLIHKMSYISAAVLVITLAVFVFLVRRHGVLKENRNLSRQLIEINDNGIKRIDGKWQDFKDSGEDFFDKEHDYTYDLDVFGKGSFFQMINNSGTVVGRRRLAEILKGESEKGKTDDEKLKAIEKRQELIKKLSGMLGIRQRIYAESLITPDSNSDMEKLYSWAENPNTTYTKWYIVFLAWLLPCLTLFLSILSFSGMSTGVYKRLPLLTLAIQIAVLIPYYVQRAEILSNIAQYSKSLKAYSNMFKYFEKKKLIKNLGINEKIISTEIEKLSRIADAAACRNNSFYIVLNILTLWDYHCTSRLEKWKDGYGKNLRKSLEILGEIEALSSLSNVNFEHPDWACPKIDTGSPKLEAKLLGHPLLNEKKVCNDVTINKNSSVLLITGSNMSGKSTLLRTTGINLVLAYSGCFACAKEFKCSLMEIHTCMRVSDNLEVGISSFYAELLRIKLIVEAAKKNSKVFFLLDEIFKGTNSYDRHMGAKILINKLMNIGAAGLVSTHDLELASLEDETNGRIKNYHFMEFYKDDKIYFDYKLRSGVSTTRNAMYLIKMAGID